MSLYRHRAHLMGATFLTSLSLSVTSLAGCASFDPNPLPTGTKPVAPAATAGPGTATPAVGATAPAAPIASTNLTGQAFAGGKPLANATVTVVNAFTGKPLAGLVSAGAGNLVAAGAGNFRLAQATEIKTDANGNYDLNIPEMKNSDMVRIIVKTPGGAELTSLAGGRSNASTYALKQTSSKRFKVKIDIASTLATNAMGGVLKLLASMSEADRGKAIDNFVDKVADAEKDFQEKIAKSADPAATEQSLLGKLEASAAKTEVGNSTNSDAAQNAGLLAFKEIAAMLEAVGVDSTSQDFASLVADTLKQVLTVATAGDGIQENATLVISSEDFPPTLNIDLTKIEEGTITYEDPVTGDTEGVVVEVTEEITQDEESLPDTLSNESEFAPNVSITYDTTDTDSPLKLTVSQADGQFDVSQISAFFPRDLVSHLDFNAATTLNEPSETLVSGGWATFASTTGHKIWKSSATATTFTGVWKDSTGLVIANVEGTDDGSLVELTFDFAMAGNDMVDTEGGSAKLEALASVIKLNVTELEKQNSFSPPVYVTFRSRNSADTSNTSDTGGGEVASYSRLITLIK